MLACIVVRSLASFRFCRGCGPDETGEITMPTWRHKKSKKEDYLKRRSYDDGRALVDDAHRAVHRLYCDAFGFWRACKGKPCKRHRRCCGEPTQCLMRGLPGVPPAERQRAEKDVIAGGPRRVPAASHVEQTVRQSALAKLVSWGFG
jgi:hypothetical protein